MSFLLLNNQDEEYLKPSKPKNNEDYDYWEGSFKGYSPEELLALSDRDFYKLMEEFLGIGMNEDLLEDYDFFELTDLEEGEFLRNRFLELLKDCNYQKGKKIDIFRVIEVDRIEEINFEEKGVCWTYNPKNISLLEDIHLEKTKNYKIRFAGTTPSDNIDWIYSLYLDFETGYNQELRVYNPKKVFLTGYLSIDSKTNTLYSKYGDVSNISKGITQ